MNYNQTEVEEYVLKTLTKKNIKYVVQNFHSGSSMIDIWFENKFYVLQSEAESIGFSLVNNGNSGFDTIPDERFYDSEKFIQKFNDTFIPI